MAKVKTHWTKTTPFGDYGMTHDRLSARTNKITQVIRQAKALGVCGKHAGSKPLDRLLNGIRTVEMAVQAMKAAAKKS